MPSPRACVVGLGVVGVPLAATLATSGFQTMGQDVDAARVAAVSKGRSPFASDEPGLAALLKRAHRAGLGATTRAAEAVRGANVVFVTVQTPVGPTGRPDLRHLRAALRSIGRHLDEGALVIVESTLPPGTMRDVVQPTLEKATSRKAGPGFLLGHCPERVMPGRLLRNLRSYDRVVGGFDAASTRAMVAVYRRFVRGRLSATDMTTAEVVKTTENAYRDVQIAFANEVALICQALGVDAWDVRDHVNRVEGRTMHLPGVGVGGHCIPKDGLLLASASAGSARLLTAARRVNDAMPAATAALVETLLGDVKGKTVALLGVAYLPGSDDTRNTPVRPLADTLRAAGAKVRLTDPYVEALDGQGVEPEVAKALRGAHAAVLCTAHPAYRRADLRAWARAMAGGAVFVDGRGVIAPKAARAAGFVFAGIGRPAPA